VPTIDEILAAVKPQLAPVADQMKTNFMAAFGSWVESSHKDRLEQLFKDAAEAKLMALVSQDPEKVIEWQDIYRAKLASMTTLGLAVQIVGEAKAASILKEMASQILDVFGAVAATVIGIFIKGAISGLSGGVGPAVSEGIASLAASFLKRK